MTIQIGKLRTFYSKEKEKNIPFVTLKKGFHYKSLKELFDNVQADLDNHYSEEDQYNLFYTVAHHLEGKRERSSWQGQDIIPFDLDGIDLDRIDEYPSIVAEVCGFDLDKCAIVYSGNGCHILLQVPFVGVDNEYIKRQKKGYRKLLERIELACKERNLPFDIDTTAWDYGRILRLPFTKNKKVKDGVEVVKEALLIQNNLEEQDWSIPAPPEVSKDKALTKNSFPLPDHKTVVKECHFFNWLKDSPEEVHEPHAYAMLSISGHFPDGNKTSEEYWERFSSPSINSKDLQDFTEQAITTAGPRTCEGINELFGKCGECPHYNKIQSPILIKDPNHIGTETMGFSTTTITGNGNKAVKRHYEDLRLWYKREKNYIHIPNRRSTLMEFNGKFYEEVSEAHIKAIAQENFSPLVEDDKIRIQFLNQVKASPDTIKPDDFLHGYKENLMNLDNGVLDLTTGELLEHSKEFGFTACMPYEYDVNAECPNWEAFLSASMRGDKDLMNLLEEMLAFVLSGMSYDKYQYYFLLIGKGFNGKSTFITLLQRMLGHGNYTAHPLEDLIDKQDARADLATSLANLVADSSASALKGKDLTRLKSWTGNDAVTGRALYKDSISFVNRSKFIFGFNDYPEIKATSTGDTRRIIAIPFDADFKGSDKSFFIKDLEKKLLAERGGILNRVVKAYDRLLSNGFTTSSKLDSMKKDIRKSADSVYDFITDFVEYEKDSKVFCSDIYDAYTADNDYSAVNFAKQPRLFNKEIRNIMGTNDAMKGMEVKKIRVGQRTALGIVNAKLNGNVAVQPKF